MHKIKQIIQQVNKTHKGLGPMVAVNILAAKAKKTILNIAPAGCGKSAATRVTTVALHDRSKQFTSLTLAGMTRLRDEFEHYDGHVAIDDLGAEKSIWSRVSTITTLANLVYSHQIRKITFSGEIKIEDFRGSVSLNIQPVLLNSLIQSEEWVSVVRDTIGIWVSHISLFLITPSYLLLVKVIRYYHLIRPANPASYTPTIDLDWGENLETIKLPKYKGKLWYQLVAIGLTQWSYARINEHLPDLLKASASLDSRAQVNASDYRLLAKLLMPLQLERYIVNTYGFEEGRVFDNNFYCILVELASFKEPTLDQICEDYKVSPRTVERLIDTVQEWCFIKANSPKHVLPTPQALEMLNLCGAYQKW